MRKEPIEDIEKYLKEHPNSTIKQITNDLGFSRKKVERYLKGMNNVGITNTTIPFTHSLKAEKKIEETNYEELEIKIERAIKQTLWEMPLEKRLIKNGVYFKGQLFYEEDINEVMKKHPCFVAYELKTINEAFGKNLTNDEDFISNVAIKIGLPPDNPLFKKLLWKCFSKIKIAILMKKLK